MSWGISHTGASTAALATVLSTALLVSLPAPATSQVTSETETTTGTRIGSPAWVGDLPLNAGWQYSSGTAHRAWDVGMPIGTKLFAPRSSIVIGLNDGVANNPPGVNPGPNSPSNWVLLCSTVKGQPVSSLWQHVSPGIPVTVGQRINGPKVDSQGKIVPGTGTLFAYSGNTGNSSGPHLHLATMTGCAAPTGPGNDTPAALSRYNYLSRPETLVWQPSKLWNRPVIDSSALVVASRARSKSSVIAAFRQAVGAGSSGKKANENFRTLIVNLKTTIAYKNRSTKVTRHFVKKLAKRTEDFSAR